MSPPESDLPPCKTFNKRKAITCYKLRFNSQSTKFDHYELYRISNETPGEYYLFPIETLQKKSRMHYSYHKSGVFHWKREGMPSSRPIAGEADARSASLLVQAMQHLHGQLDGYCVARGRNVADEAMDAMIDIMDGYILAPLRYVGVSLALRERGNYSICLIDTPYRQLAQRIMSAASAQGESFHHTIEDVKNIFDKNGIRSDKLTILEPAPSYYVSYSKEVTEQLLRIARALVDEKMKQKPNAFWTNFKSISPNNPATNL